MKKGHSMRAVIVGAGIAGLAAAQGLRLIGWDTEIYEQAEALEPLGAGLSLSANALRGLRTLGLYDLVTAAAQPIQQLELLDQGGRVLQSTDFQELGRRYGHLAMAVLHRGDLHKALLAKLPERMIRTGMECVGARETDDRIVLDFASGEAVEANFVVAGDGIHSVVRKALFPESREHFARYTCWRAIAPYVPGDMNRARLTESWGRASDSVSPPCQASESTGLPVAAPKGEMILPWRSSIWRVSRTSLRTSMSRSRRCSIARLRMR
ncbi:FAD-dependent monooxygenase [Ensifer sp. BR816]|uniref:FAD-dependent monooxygenase n=1 Tax=Rhizobium sp. (strain BR816) TaxID=1057002 RepID=UPI0009FD6A62